MSNRQGRLISPFALAVIACNGGEVQPTLEPLEIAEGCNPLAADWDCLLPWPSDVFLVKDDGMPTGYRVRHPAEGLPRTTDDEAVDFVRLHPADGFSHHPQILALFPEGIDDDNLVGLRDDLELSRDPDQSPTLLIDLATGEPLLHLAEVDPRAASDERRALVIRPLVRLEHERRYLVAVAGLRDPDGEFVAPPEGFRRLRDGQTEVDVQLTELALQYEDEIFPALEQLGWKRSDVQLAWTFSTGSEEHVTGDMLRARDLALSVMDREPPVVTVSHVDQPEGLYRRVHGTLTVPLFVSDETPGATLHRDSSNRVAQNGTAEVPFLAIVPPSVAAATSAARVVQYGHGFFGDRYEIEGDFVTRFAEETQTVVVAVDWWGLSAPDQVFVVYDLTEHPSEMLRFTDRIHQGMINQIALSLAVREGFSEDEAFRLEGRSLIDPQSLYFYGISAGHILGGTQVALNPEIDRVALSVGGAAFSAIMMRSVPFKQFLGFVELLVPDPLGQQKYISLSQLTLDRVDPGTYAPHLMRDTYEGSPASRRVLMHVGLGDTSVPNLASHIHARALGIPLLSPDVRRVAGLDSAPAPQESALVEFDFGLPEPLPGSEATPPEEPTRVHVELRELAASIAQVDAFFRPDGMVISTCDGPCDPG